MSDYPLNSKGFNKLKIHCLDAVAHGGNHGNSEWGEPPRPRCLPKTVMVRLTRN
ncbi:hypothetical protein BJP36_35765 [Moorena producens JHB]|uniref:Uncharacterized protein n=1 Tax=Moorena producens (strain JHB) TaxID=1454205 RepID=A0A9Q9UW36_MOOP1|nr:hypothetical protein [Moorena producens]WAN69451.1 hypothetical protein BJP36_35765 [Moorena producens JHB]